MGSSTKRDRQRRANRAAHVHPMTTTLPRAFYAAGHLTDDVLILGSSPATLLGAIIEDYLEMRPPEQAAARHAFALATARSVQDALITEGVVRGTFSWEGLSEREIDRLQRDHRIEDRGGDWERTDVPLILVSSPSSSYRPGRRRNVLVLQTSSSGALLGSLMRAGQLELLGHLDG